MPSNNKNQSPSSKKQTRVVKNENIYSKKKIEKTKSSKYIITIILLIISLLFNSYAIYHFVTFNHNKVKIVTKTKIKQIVSENILFLGDSITHRYDLNKYYKNKHIVNSGEEGNLTSNILDNMEDRVYRYNPSKVFLLIGTNDIAWEKSPDEIVDNISKIVDNIKSNRKNAAIYVESIYPTNNEVKQSNAGIRSNDKIDRTNEKIEQLCKNEDITYIDINSSLKNDNGKLKEEYSEDGLHISDKGYEIITDIIKKYI